MITTLERPTTTATELRFTVYGVPVPQGSKIPMINRAKGYAYLIEANSNELKTWRERVKTAAQSSAAACGWTNEDVPVSLRLAFLMPRPKKPTFDVPAARPDIDKLTRAVMDGLTFAEVYRDDSRVVDLSTSKRYSISDCGVEVVLAKGGAL